VRVSCWMTLETNTAKARRVAIHKSVVFTTQVTAHDSLRNIEDFPGMNRIGDE
jgi:hypothetical protein